MTDIFVPGGAHAPIPVQRTAKGLAYEAFVRNLRQELSGMTAESQKRAKRANVDFIRGLLNPSTRLGHLSELEKAILPSSVHVDAALATLSVMYANDEYIGERLMPIVPVSKRSDVYFTYNKRDRLAAPSDEITGTRSAANEVDQGRSTDNYSVSDYALKNFLDLSSVQNQDAPLSEMVDVVEAVNEMLAFKREKRILTIVTTSGNFGTSAAAGTVWSDTTGGTIIADIAAASAGIWSGHTPTKRLGFCSLVVWNTGILGNPVVRDLFKFVKEGLVSTQQFAQYFGLEDVLISRSREDTANSGQTASYARMMTAKYFGIVSVANSPSRRSLHFGSTFRLQDMPLTTQWTDPDVGVRGGIYARVGVSEQHKVVSTDAAALVTGAVT